MGAETRLETVRELVSEAIERTETRLKNERQRRGHFDVNALVCCAESGVLKAVLLALQGNPDTLRLYGGGKPAKE